jgi:hypothetical protein
VIVGIPADKPVTTPDVETEPRVALLLLQVPPDGVDDNVVVLPGHTAAVPVIAVGIGFTV